MRPGRRFIEKLLVVADDFEDSSAILAWRPFDGGNTLGEIVTAHNLRCEGGLLEKLPGSFVECVREVAPALTITSYRPEDFASFTPGEGDASRLKIILLVLDSSMGRTAETLSLVENLSQQSSFIHLLQMSQNDCSETLADSFTPGQQVMLADPKIFRRQSELEDFLHAFRETLVDIWGGVASNPFDVRCLDNVFREPYLYPRHGQFMRPDNKEEANLGRICRSYNEALAQMAADARDAALFRKLTKEEAVNLGRTAAIQEFLLARIMEQVRPRPGYPVSVAPIRNLALDLSAEQPLKLRDMRPVKLVSLTLVDSRKQPVPLQCEALEELGFADGVQVMVHFDRPDLWDKLETLGDLVTASSFAAELPGRIRTIAGKVGLNEFSLGVHDEESFYRRQDRRPEHVTNSSERNLLLRKLQCKKH